MAEVAQSFLANTNARDSARAQLEASETLPPFWRELRGLGWLGLHLPESFGGEGYGLPELVVLAEVVITSGSGVAGFEGAGAPLDPTRRAPTLTLDATPVSVLTGARPMLVPGSRLASRVSRSSMVCSRCGSWSAASTKDGSRSPTST